MTAQLVDIPVYLGPALEGLEAGFAYCPPLATIVLLGKGTALSAMLDTGAPVNFIARGVADKLGLSATGAQPSIGSSTGKPISLPMVELEFVFETHALTRFRSGFALMPDDRGFDAMLGRDFLRFAHFVSNGFDRQYTLSIPHEGQFVGILAQNER